MDDDVMRYLVDRLILNPPDEITCLSLDSEEDRVKLFAYLVQDMEKEL